MKLETERLIIKPITVEDADVIFELYNCPLFIKYVGDRNIKNQADAKVYIETKILSQIKNLGFGNNIVIRKEDNTKIGNCGIFKRNGLENPDIGFSFLSQFHKKGYAFESANIMVKSAFENHCLTTLNAITDQKNINSQKLIKKLGFTYQKLIKLPNDTVEILLFELTKEDYLKQ